MKAKKVDSGWFVRFDRGEEIMQALIDFIAQKKLLSGTIAGIGALTEVELGYFNRDTRQYQKRKFDGIYELLSLKGNIAYVDNRPMVHAHCVLGDADYRLVGGHLFSGVIAVTGEVFIQAFTEKFERKLDPEVELNLLDF
jgi:predicted DNA-binding protein with PD1-like motif